ncbi:MAG: X-Pro dipeptidyl-peptidase [Thermoplasmata archaeon]|jgi:predicted acyl esterase|nr:X-Pro dipeptidyl-peptidase [Thermoplasmata archaeon]
MRSRSLAITGLLLALTLGGCLEAYDEFDGFDTDSPYRNPGVFEGAYMTGAAGSLPLVTGSLRPAMRPELITLESARPAYGPAADAMGFTGVLGSQGDDARVDIVMAVWRPDNHTAPTPIIVDAGPYYEQDGLTMENQTQMTPLLVQNMLPRGYTVVQLAVRGTGTAGGCMDLFGPDETADLDQALTWLGEQPWSNGNIGMIGVSYDGSTPWTAAGTGNPYLKTIVPISGLPDVYDLMLHNGSAETRAAIMHSKDVYWGFGFSEQFPAGGDLWEENVGPLLGEPWPVPPAGIGHATGRKEYQDRQNLLCPEALEGQALGQVAAAEGSRMAAASSYWVERDHRDDVLANYKGSVFLVHGLQDWNVDPHSAVPFNLALRAKGLEVKEWYGQWGHQTPDGNCQPGAPGWVVLACRMDFGDILARWFDKHLLGDAQVDTGPAIQVQDDLGFWRNADAFPPAAPAWQSLALGADGVLGSGAAGEATLKASTGAMPTNIVQLVSEPFPDGLHLSGMPQAKVPFKVTGEGGFLAAWLFDMDPKGLVRSPTIVRTLIAEGSTVMTWKPAGIPVVGHAQMNLRFYAGGEEPQALQPGERYVAQVEFEPLEVHIPEGHRLALWLFQYPYPDHASATTPSDVVVSFDGDAQLLLPTLQLDPRTVFPVPGVAFPNSTAIPQMYVRMPVLQGASPSQEAGPAATVQAVDACLALRRCAP